MCLILFAVAPVDETGEKFDLVVAANRDELHGRPSQAADYWRRDDNVLGGIDLEAGGTWLGLTKNGRFAAVTNFAEKPFHPIPPRSRGELTANFLLGDMSCEDYLIELGAIAGQYRGFNLLISDGQGVYYYNNQTYQAQQLVPGFYGLSNQLLDCSWPKVISGREQLQALAAGSFETDKLFALLANRGDETAHSARFIQNEVYGTSSCTVVKLGEPQIEFEERNFKPDGELALLNRFQFERLAQKTHS